MHCWGQGFAGETQNPDLVSEEGSGNVGIRFRRRRHAGRDTKANEEPARKRGQVGEGRRAPKREPCPNIESTRKFSLFVSWSGAGGREGRGYERRKAMTDRRL